MALLASFLLSIPMVFILTKRHILNFQHQDIGAGRLVYKYKASVLGVHDGDTVKLLVDLGFNICTEIDVRIANYSAPELNEPGGLEALEKLIKLVLGKTVFVQTEKSRTGKDIRSFARYVGKITTEAGIDVGQYMESSNANQV